MFYYFSLSFCFPLSFLLPETRIYNPLSKTSGARWVFKSRIFWIFEKFTYRVYSAAPHSQACDCFCSKKLFLYTMIVHSSRLNHDQVALPLLVGVMNLLPNVFARIWGKPMVFRALCILELWSWSPNSWSLPLLS